MIKKFKYFIESKNIMDILSEEEIEDQFLRLIEILGCRFSTYADMEKYYNYHRNIKDNISDREYYVNFMVLPPYNRSDHKIKTRSLTVKDWEFLKRNKKIEENVLEEFPDDLEEDLDD